MQKRGIHRVNLGKMWCYEKRLSVSSHGRGTREPKDAHVSMLPRLASSGAISACYPDRSIMSVSHIERYHWVVKVARRLSLLELEPGSWEEMLFLLSHWLQGQPLPGPWPLIYRFDRPCFCRRFCSSLHFNQSATRKP